MQVQTEVVSVHAQFLHSWFSEDGLWLMIRVGLDFTIDITDLRRKIMMPAILWQNEEP